jgi:hypothetical protein
MTRSPSLCIPPLHVWRRHESERTHRVSPSSFCDCTAKQFRQLAMGERYDVAYFNANGLIVPGAGPRTRGVDGK